MPDPVRCRARWARYKLPTLALVSMSIAVVASLLAVNTARTAMRRTRLSVPPVVARVSWIAPTYLDRAAIDEQFVDPPRVIRSLLWPALGSPAILDPGADLDIVLDRAYPGTEFALIARDALRSLDDDLYALPPMPQGAALLSARIAAAHASDNQGSLEMVLSPEERSATAGLLADPDYQRSRTQLLARVQNDSTQDARDAVDRVRLRVARTVEGSGANLKRLVPQSDCVRLGIGLSCVVRVRLPRAIQPGLYVLLLIHADRTLADFQMNAVSVTRGDAAPASFLVASDMQWGDAPSIAGAALSFVSLVNAADRVGQAPQFIVMTGDIVDGQFGSAGNVWSKLFGSAESYTRDFIQAWLVLAALRVPIYLVPGNHDGYRFEDAVGELGADGLLLFQSTFGPLYHVVDRPPWRFVLLNSDDLPDASRTVRRGEASNVVERLSDRLNVLNWGGGVRAAQHLWLRYQLGLDDGSRPPNLMPALFLHHDPRGSYAALRRDFQQRQHQWTAERHLPINAELSESTVMPVRRAPRFPDTEEIHLGYYTPLRDAKSVVRGTDWFELGVRVSLPDSLGWPGWSKYQQGWHAPAVYGHSFSDVRAEADELVAPARLLHTIVDSGVRAIFNGHDNRFAFAHMTAGESVLTAAAEQGLLPMSSADRRRELIALRVGEPLDVYHVADLSDFNSDGHGFFWVTSEKGGFRVLEIDHW